jgi:hypothetical protein
MKPPPFALGLMAFASGARTERLVAKTSGIRCRALLCSAVSLGVTETQGQSQGVQ